MCQLIWDQSRSSAHSAALYPVHRPFEPQKDTLPTQAIEIDLTDDFPPPILKRRRTINLSLSIESQNSPEFDSERQQQNQNRKISPHYLVLSHPRPRRHLRGSRALCHRLIASRPRIRPPIQTLYRTRFFALEAPWPVFATKIVSSAGSRIIFRG